MTRITTIRAWKRLKHHISLQGHRINIWRPLTTRAMLSFLSLRVPCAHCGAEIQPVRVSNHGWYLAVTCPLKASIACARSSEARAACAEVRAKLAA